MRLIPHVELKGREVEREAGGMGVSGRNTTQVHQDPGTANAVDDRDLARRSTYAPSVRTSSIQVNGWYRGV